MGCLEGLALDNIKKEIEKCELLCANCHAEEEYKITLKNRESLDLIIPKKESVKKGDNCTDCGKFVSLGTIRCHNCDIKLKIANSKIPQKEILEKLIWEKPSTHIAKEFGVSDKTIEKWCKRYNLDKPSRGYWVKKKSE